MIIDSNIDSCKQLAVMRQSTNERRARALKEIAKLRAKDPEAFDSAMAERGVVEDWERLLSKVPKGQTRYGDSDLTELLADGAVALHLDPNLSLEEFAKQQRGRIWGPPHSRRKWYEPGAIKKAHQEGEKRYEEEPKFMEAVHRLAQEKLNALRSQGDDANS